ncbi:type II secretion system protein GspI [Enterobacterales bacterium CwR94]|nr:type II secretion system protein GspI [Enterobacterales bacterium CwR94]
MNQRGMTLIEVMIAMALLATAGLALMKTSHEQVRNLDYLERKQMAAWVAENQLVTMQLQPLRAALSTQRGEIVMANQRWFWSQRAVATDNPAVWAIEVEVRETAAAPRPIVRLHAWRS